MLLLNKFSSIPIRPALIAVLSSFLISCSDGSASSDQANRDHSSDSSHDSSHEDSHSNINIDKASWSHDRHRLTVSGNNVSRYSTVSISYGNKGDNGYVIETTKADSHGDWEIRISDIDPVPCDVTASDGNGEDDKSVHHAPRDCSNDGGAPPPPAAQCNDGIDNDGDGLVDMDDPGCTDVNDNDEYNAPPATQCNDGVDNDGDGLVDMDDPGCTDASDNDEYNAPPATQCNDGVDNDGDGLVDMNDPGCTDASDNDEYNAPAPVTQCNDGIDNDGDGLVDMDDPGCTDASDNDESNTAPPAPEPTPLGDGIGSSGNYTILAANDLGMHCADQDFRMFSILPPYNVLNAQVLRKGGSPALMSPADGISVTYRAVESNYFSDLTLPGTVQPDSIASWTTTGFSLTDFNNNDVFKNNFWVKAPVAGNPIDEIGFIAYDHLYPEGLLATVLRAPDVGLPAPDLAGLYLLGSGLQAEQAHMPGTANTPQPFHGYVEDFPFFVDFPFGYVVQNFKRYTAEGIPTSSIDDNGRSNPYPLMRVEARDSSDNILASVDAVTPVASEADCAICHAAQEVCNADESNMLTCSNLPATKNENSSINFIDTLADTLNMLGATAEQKVINSAKLNILRLHDGKHGTSLAGDNADGTFSDGSTPNIVCANCHYTPALDLAHLGPNDVNGKEQTQHISMSRAMHGVHGALANDPAYAQEELFPIMPAPGASRSASVAEDVLMRTCYNCHPGKKAKCLRGAMGGSGTVCQDCHGQLTQVGDDFTENFPTGGFPGGADLTKRVPWGTEPSCDSCHVGDVLQVAQLSQSGRLNDTVMNANDAHGNTDDLRLLMTYTLSNHKQTQGAPDNLKLLKFPESRFATTEALYRMSGSSPGHTGTGMEKGHGGLSCEGCHGSTHAIWPNQNPFSNDNKASNDIQGHSGTIIECSSCHTGNLGNTLDGPHGMHPVGRTSFADGGHENMAERDGDSCRACHGQNGEGTVLSRAAADRDFSGFKRGGQVSKGTPITCTMCHGNEL